jgi:hypothetical protein
MHGEQQSTGTPAPEVEDCGAQQWALLDIQSRLL